MFQKSDEQRKVCRKTVEEQLEEKKQKERKEQKEVKKDTAAVSTRRPIFDHIRAFACIGIIGLHITGDRSDALGLTFQTYFRIWLPMFFLLSGALILTSKKEESIGKFYLKRVEKALIPLLIYGMLYTCWINPGQRILAIPTKAAIKQAILLIPQAISLNLQGPQFYHLWFMYSIMGLYLVMPFFKKALQAMNERMLIALAALILVLQACTDYIPVFGYVFGFTNDFQERWAIYIIFGYIIMQDFAKKKYPQMVIAGVIAAVASFLWKYYFPNHISANYYDLAPHMILQTCGMFAVFMLVEKYLTKWNWLNWIAGRISKYSLSIYMIHGYILSWWQMTYGIRSDTVHGTLYTLLLAFLMSLAFAIIFDNVVVFNVQRLFRWICRKIGCLLKKDRATL